jgi:hypothetical protein
VAQSLLSFVIIAARCNDERGPCPASWGCVPVTPILPGEPHDPRRTRHRPRRAGTQRRPALTLAVANTGDRPIQVGSHYHFAETNPALQANFPDGTKLVTVHEPIV